MSSSVPKHVAIIMDGNRRWATQRALPQSVGHWKGAEVSRRVVTAAVDSGIEVLTLFTFSTENWLRSPDEVDALMEVIYVHLLKYKQELIVQGVRLHAIGRTEKLPVRVQEAIDEVVAATASGKKMDLILALNYGGRDDICRAASKVAEEVRAGKMAPHDISEEVFSRFLDTAKWPDPDLVIRTSGEKRISNFLLWQLSYAELYVTDSLWPNFCKQDLSDAILEYQKRRRRQGQ